MIRLVVLLGLSAGLLAHAPRSHAQELLAEGLPNATLSIQDIKGVWLPIKKGDIFRLTDGKLVFVQRLSSGGTEIVEQPDPRTAAAAVGTADGKYEWKWDPAAKKFAGSKPAPRLALDVTPAKTTPAEEAKYLYFAACRLWDRLDAAVQMGDVTTLDAVRKRAEALGMHARDGRLAPDVGGLFRDIESDVADFKKRVAKRKELWAEFQTQAAKLDQDARQKAAQAANESMAGMFKLLVGGLTASSTDRYYDPRENTVYAVTTVNQGSVRLAGEGLGDMMAAGARQSQNRAYFNSLKSGLRADIVRDLEQADADFTRAFEARRAKTEAFAKSNFGIEPAAGIPDGKSLIKRMVECKDQQTLQKILAELAANDRGRAARDNPFRLADLYDCEARTPSLSAETVVGQLRDRSRDMAAAAKLVPAGRVYDSDRATFLLQAAAMANTAAHVENAARTLAGSVSTNALFAGRCVEKLEELNLLDIDGQIRKQQVFAYARSGRVPEAAEQAAKLGEQLGGDAEYQYMAAQVYAAVRKPDAAVKALSAALKAGFSDVAAVRANPNFQGLLANKGFKALLDVRVSPSVVLQLQGGFGAPTASDPKRNVLTLTNDSDFPLTNVKVQLDVYYNGSTVAGSHKDFAAPRINPKETVTFEGAAAGPTARTYQPKAISKLAVACDQLPAAAPQRSNPPTGFK